jgi:NADH dehydrogenase (ubiquinone) Fe-S protein 6
MSRRVAIQLLNRPAAALYCGGCSVVGKVGAQAVRAASTSSQLPKYRHGIHRSNAESLVKEVKVLIVDDHVAVCDGGSAALGHPVEYIQLDTVSNEPQICKYCGLRFIMGEPHHH